MWDPASLTISTVSLPKTSNDQTDVQFAIEGTGFDAPDRMHGVFVRMGGLPGRQDVIPCNEIDVSDGDTRATFRVCPKGKQHGTYGLIWWLDPPTSITSPEGNEVTDVPINDVCVRYDMLVVQDKGG